MAEAVRLGFIGVGVMGEPMCRNLAAKSGCRVLAYDVNPQPLRRLALAGVETAPTVARLVEQVAGVFLCLPGAPQVEAVMNGPQGVLAHARSGQFVVDMSTCPPRADREWAEKLGALGVDFADAPVARTRQAAQQGTLSIMVGGAAALVERLRPYLACMGSDITHCGAVGSGQVVKLLNNLVLCQNVLALAGALEVGGKAGVEERLLLETLSKGSADSFALRNHGMKAMLPQEYPERAFSVRYMLKDVGYALELAEQQGVALESGYTAQRLYERAVQAGLGDQYFPVVRKTLA